MDMDATRDLDEDFVNFESVSQRAADSPAADVGRVAIVVSGARPRDEDEDDDVSLLDDEARERESRRRRSATATGASDSGDRTSDETTKKDFLVEEDERNNNAPMRAKTPGADDAVPRQQPVGVGVVDDDSAQDQHQQHHLFAAAFAYNATSKRLTMIPVKYKMKEERRKVLKISINKLKKIDDPESWLCRSVLINNTMKKLQKEARDEKMQKQMSTTTAYAKATYLIKSTMDEDAAAFPFSEPPAALPVGHNNNNDGEDDRVCALKMDDQDCFYQKEFIQKEKDDVFCGLDKAVESERRTGSVATSASTAAGGQQATTREDEPLSSGGVPLNEDFVDKIPSIKRCASRKRSLDEDGTASEVLNLGDEDDDDEPECKRQRANPSDEVDECDVHDVLSQLYMPPTPRMLTSIDSDTDDDDLNVVDMDATTSPASTTTNNSYKLPVASDAESFESHLLPSGRRRSDPSPAPGPVEGDAARRRLADDIFSCFNVCETSFLGDARDAFDNFLCETRGKDKERTSGVRGCEGDGVTGRGADEDEDFIELEDEEDIKRRLSASLYHHQQQQQQQQQLQLQQQQQQDQQRKSDKCESFFSDDATSASSANCDNNQFSCGHTVNMFNDIQSVTFHNLIASLET